MAEGPDGETPQPSRHHWLGTGKVALGTAATIVGLASGVLALKGQIFGDNSPSQERVAVFQQEVGKICDRVNEVQESRDRRTRRLEATLAGSDTLAKARVPLIGEAEAAIDGFGDLKARLQSLQSPSEALKRQQEATTALFDKNFARLQSYRDRLSRAGDMSELRATTSALPRTAMEQDAINARARLQRLGGPACRLDSRTSRVVPLAEKEARANEFSRADAPAPGFIVP